MQEQKQYQKKESSIAAKTKFRAEVLDLTKYDMYTSLYALIEPRMTFHYCLSPPRRSVQRASVPHIDTGGSSAVWQGPLSPVCTLCIFRPLNTTGIWGEAGVGNSEGGAGKCLICQQWGTPSRWPYIDPHPSRQRAKSIHQLDIFIYSAFSKNS